MVLWSANHVRTLLPALIVMVIISLVLRKTLIRKTRRVRIMPFQIVTVVILALEIAKQVVSFTRGYDLYAIPLHYCSLAIFTMPMLAFYSGKYAKTVHTVTAAILSAIFLLTAIYPELIYGSSTIDGYFTEFMHFHTVTFHNLVMFAFLLIPALDLCEDSGKGSGKIISVFIVVYSAVAAPMSYILQTNFNNFYSCNVPPLETVRLAVQGVLGVVPTQILYVLLLVVLDILFTVMAYWFYRLLRHLLQGNKATAKV